MLSLEMRLSMCISLKDRHQKYVTKDVSDLKSALQDGPSAGVTLVTALLSLSLGKSVKKDLAMTGM